MLNSPESPKEFESPESPKVRKIDPVNLTGYTPKGFGLPGVWKIDLVITGYTPRSFGLPIFPDFRSFGFADLRTSSQRQLYDELRSILRLAFYLY